MPALLIRMSICSRASVISRAKRRTSSSAAKSAQWNSTRSLPVLRRISVMVSCPFAFAPAVDDDLGAYCSQSRRDEFAHTVSRSRHERG